jgi:hypothetical protein
VAASRKNKSNGGTGNDTRPARVANQQEMTMNARPHTAASKKRILKRKAARRAGNKPSLGIPPKAMARKSEIKKS